jgi:DNA-3-methyladenine glycosylase I
MTATKRRKKTSKLIIKWQSERGAKAPRFLLGQRDWLPEAAATAPVALRRISARVADQATRGLMKPKATEKVRCPWAKSDLYVQYHDREWGVPVRDDRLLFEFLILEGAQAGLSWETILKKRERYREVFDNFDAAIVAGYGQKKRRSLLADAGIVRNRLKIDAAIQNAKMFLVVQEEFGTFADYLWQFVKGLPKQNAWKTMKDVPARTPESDAMSKDLKRRGFKFVGSTICYAFMQAVGMVNDHLVECFRHRELARGASE